MPSRHHVLVDKPFEQNKVGQRLALSEVGIEAFRKSKKFSVGYITPLAVEGENGRIKLVGADEPLDLERSRTLLGRDGTLVDNYEELARKPVAAKPAPKDDRSGAGPQHSR